MFKRTYLFPLAFVLTIASAPSFAYVTARSCVDALRQIHIVDFFWTPNPEGHKKFIDAITAPSTQSIDMMMFHLTDPAVAQAFETRAAQGNFKARIILNRSTLSDDETLKIALHLQSLPGVSVVASSDVFSITHTKSMTVNDRLAFITSINLTTNAAAQRDYGVTTDDAGIVQEMRVVFENDFKLGDPDLAKVAAEEKNRPYQKKSPPPDQKYTPPLHEPNLLWSPVNSMQKIVDIIDYAEPGTTLYATVENIRRIEIEQAFLKAEARGVDVRLIVPGADLNSNPNYNLEAIYEMQNQVVDGKTVSVNVRLMPSPDSPTQPYMHAKSIVAVGKNGPLIAIMSENFTTNSLVYARELGVMFFDSGNIYQTMKANHEKDWAVSQPPPAPSHSSDNADVIKHGPKPRRP